VAGAARKEDEMTDLLDRIKTATDIAEAADTAVTMYPNQVRYLIDRIAVLEERVSSVEERASTELAIRNSRIAELEAEVERLRPRWEGIPE
jgi:predicted  nucleic acid-binding Zn-ribbon protein